MKTGTMMLAAARGLFRSMPPRAGSVGNWQRHYFPAKDFADKYRLVVATPTAATMGSMGGSGPGVRMWQPAADDAHLQNITDLVFEQFGRRNIRSFWLAGHSQGGFTSSRIVCTDFFKDKVDGWLSLSGGRIGQAPFVAAFGPPQPDGSPQAARAAPRLGSAAPGKAQAYVYPNCKGGRVVADVVRVDKGHTEALEPKVTEEIIKLIVQATGGKAQAAT